jgi:hypothetical protein
MVKITSETQGKKKKQGSMQIEVLVCATVVVLYCTIYTAHCEFFSG